MKELLEMFVTFLKIGAFTFGGGFAMLPIMEREFVTNRKWVKKEDFVDIIVLSQSFPGVLAVNSSTFIGNKIFGLKGALLALLGVSIPSITVILIIASFFTKFRSNYYVDLAMRGINSAVPALILIAMFSMLKSIKKTHYNFIIGLISTLVLIVPPTLDLTGYKGLVPHVHPLLVIIVSALLGILKYVFFDKKVGEK